MSDIISLFVRLIKLDIHLRLKACAQQSVTMISQLDRAWRMTI